MSTIATALAMRALINRTEPGRSKKTNWAKTLAIIILSGLAAGSVAYVFGRMAFLGSKGGGGVGTALLRSAFLPGLPHFYLLRGVWGVAKALMGLK